MCMGVVCIRVRVRTLKYNTWSVFFNMDGTTESLRMQIQRYGDSLSEISASVNFHGPGHGSRHGRKYGERRQLYTLKTLYPDVSQVSQLALRLNSSWVTIKHKCIHQHPDRWTQTK